MNPAADPLSLLRAVNETAAFNRWCGFQVERAVPGEVELALPWRAELGQYSGFLHAGVVAALIDTACGYAAATQLGSRVLASHFAVNCLRPAVGERFVAKARVLRAGKQQVFTHCELYAHHNGEDRLVATGETLLCVVAAAAGARRSGREPLRSGLRRGGLGVSLSSQT